LLSGLWSHARDNGSGGDRAADLDLRSALLAAAPGRERRDLVEGALREEIARVLKLPVSRVELARPLHGLGLDSLTTLELRTRLERRLGITLSATLVWNYPTVATMAPYLADRMGIRLDPAGPETPRPPAAAHAAAAPDDVESALARELARAEELLRRSHP
jgi:acyl carrier protein